MGIPEYGFKHVHKLAFGLMLMISIYGLKGSHSDSHGTTIDVTDTDTDDIRDLQMSIKGVLHLAHQF